MMRSSSILEFRPPPICDLGMRLRGVSDVCVAAVRALDVLVHGSSLRLCSLA